MIDYSKLILKPIFDRIRRRHSTKMLKIMKGYRLLKVKNQTDLMFNIITELSSTRISSSKNSFLSSIFFGKNNNAELALRQYLLVILGGNKLNRSILYSLGDSNSAICHPLPKAWRKVLRKHGLPVSELFSTLNMFFVVGKRFLHGIVLGWVNIFRGGKSLFFKTNRLDNYCFFEWIGNSNLPDGTLHSYDIISWYETQYKQKYEVDYYCHSITSVQNERSLNGKKVIYLKSVIPNIFGLKTLILFFYWFHFSILLAVFTFFRGSWWNSLMFAESIKAKIIQLTEKRYLANEYLFNISGMMYRPLWTYSAEEKGAKITMYFYSTNCEGFKSPNKNYEISYMYKIMSWTNYLVWDLYQATFVKKAVGTDVNIEIVGPIWFTSSKEKLPSYQLRSIVVFDVQPVRDIYYQSLGLNVEYYTPEICGQFLEDITMVLNKFNISIVHKRKRQIGKLAHYKYRNLLKELSKNKNYFTVDSNIAPQNIIQNSIAVISMPFTSTAIIGSHMHKPTIFYDPTGLVLKDDEAAHGIEIISGKNSLENWVKQILI